jgi:hypothetical protein
VLLRYSPSQAPASRKKPPARYYGDLSMLKKNGVSADCMFIALQYSITCIHVSEKEEEKS